MQGVAERYDDLVVAVGSGGTVCGLALGNYLTGSKLKLVHIQHAINTLTILRIVYMQDPCCVHI